MTTTVTPSDSSQQSLLARVCYRTVCRRCDPERISIDQATHQQIMIDLLYAFDPTQREVGKANEIALRGNVNRHDDEAIVSLRLTKNRSEMFPFSAQNTNEWSPSVR